MNKKLILSTIVFQVVGAIVFTVTFLLTFFDIINKNDTFVNGVIFVISVAVCFSWYAFVTKKYCNSFEIGDLVLLLIILLAFGSPMILISLNMAGIHLSVATVWMGAALLIFANNTIDFLQKKDDLVDYGEKKYTYIISKLKVWRFFVSFGPCLFGIANIFFPFDINSINLH